MSADAILQVWFKHDLRVEDHPGLLAAARSSRPIIPFFCLDPALHAELALTPQGPVGKRPHSNAITVMVLPAGYYVVELHVGNATVCLCCVLPQSFLRTRLLQKLIKLP